MSISVQGLYDDISREIGHGIGDNKFKESFPRAVNRCLDELTNFANSGTALTRITSIASTITDVDAKHEYIVYTGTRYWLGRMGWRVGDPRVASAMLLDSESSWDRAKRDYVVALSNDLQADEDEDIIASGSLA